MHPSFSPSPAVHSLLLKGLNFVPTNNNLDLDTVTKDSLEFIRRIQWSDFFANKPHRPSNAIPHLTNKSSKFPPKGALSEAASSFSRDVFQDAINLQINTPIPSNLSLSEWEALRQIRADHSLILRNADKGSAIVCMHLRDYIFEALTQLSDPTFYKLIEAPIYLETAIRIQKIMDDLKSQKFITERQLQFLSPPETPRPRHFYTLPKIHKEPSSWAIPYRIPKGRPIVSGCSSESIGAEKLIDFYLKPLAQMQPTYLRDSIHFKSTLLNHKVTPDTILASMDVQSLYTMIDTVDGLRAISHFFRANPDPSRPDQAILELLQICLNRNDFTFANLWFLQTKGTAMGKVFAPNYACLFMSRWEEAALNTALQSGLAPSIFLRYIDDIFLTFNSPASDLPRLLTILNGHDANIQLSLVSSTTSVDFLDVSVYKSGSHLRTRLYSKPTDSHLILHKSSFHPPHTFKGIVKSQILRFARLCDSRTDFSSAYRILKAAIVSVGYSNSFVRQIKKAVLQTLFWPRSVLSPFIAKGYHPCLGPRCKTCSHSKSTLAVRGPKPASDFLICQHLTCASSSVIYGISCLLCSPKVIIYVGQTSNTLRERLTGHRSDISLQTDKPISIHFNSPGHSIKHLRICALEWLSNPEGLTSREMKWIKRLGTESPPGINCQENSHLPPSIPIILDYHPALGPFYVRIARRAAELELNFKPIRASRRHKNLQAYLAPTKLKLQSHLSN